jgi:hypothetical protein
MYNQLHLATWKADDLQSQAIFRRAELDLSPSSHPSN